MESYYVFSDENHYRLAFTEKDLAGIEKMVNDQLLDDMMNYACSGCRACCDSGSSEWCTRRFKETSEIGDYLRMLFGKGYRPKTYIEKVSFIPKEVGYQIEEEFVWSLTQQYMWKIEL